jgi:hypothetical protein
MYIYADLDGDQLTAGTVGDRYPAILVTIVSGDSTGTVEFDPSAARDLAAALVHRANELDPAGALYLTPVTPELEARTRAALETSARRGSELIELAERTGRQS